jgi:hypothetical protein
MVSVTNVTMPHESTDYTYYTDDYDLCAECESLPVSKHKYPSKHKSTHNMLVFRASLPYVVYKRADYHARNDPRLYAAPLKGEDEDEFTIPLDGSEVPPLTEATQEDVSFTSVRLWQDNEKSSGDTTILAFSGTTATSVADEDANTCAECGVKLDIYYACLHCAGQISMLLKDNQV